MIYSSIGSHSEMWHRNPVAVVIGVSLSEPHTSMTALQDACTCMYVCMSGMTIYRIFKLNERIQFCACANKTLQNSNFQRSVKSSHDEPLAI